MLAMFGSLSWCFPFVDNSLGERKVGSVFTFPHMGQGREASGECWYQRKSSKEQGQKEGCLAAT